MVQQSPKYLLLSPKITETDVFTQKLEQFVILKSFRQNFLFKLATSKCLLLHCKKTVAKYSRLCEISQTSEMPTTLIKKTCSNFFTVYV